jgi:hypothetical protein
MKKLTAHNNYTTHSSYFCFLGYVTQTPIGMSEHSRSIVVLGLVGKWSSTIFLAILIRLGRRDKIGTPKDASSPLYLMD